MSTVRKIISRIRSWKQELTAPQQFRMQYYSNLKTLRTDSKRPVLKEFHCDATDHPVSYVDFECSFAARHIGKKNPTTILDIGSYRHFILGLQAKYKVTTLDVRPRPKATDNEVVITGDAKRLDLPDNSIDAVVSLCAIEHFGLGRYGDEFDLSGDKKACQEMIRVLNPGGVLILTTTITQGSALTVFNAHRIYDYAAIQALLAPLERVEEAFFSHNKGGWCSREEVSSVPGIWDVYCGCWKKPAN